MARIIDILPEITGEESLYLQKLIQDLPDDKARTFATIYRQRRKDPQLILILALIGLFGIAGIHRMIINQVGMGILYFFTMGLCLIGTIIDMVNHQKLALEYNQVVANEVIALTR